ncbi:Hypothetical protein SLY_0424 [Strawberry lethal yellows phytoplasma (CPA) str. NZSb11]|uniref:Uncharacterized protein n=1 Tax=Strawberry lethal yellows phytoplasma (CPA) str. NZSb11 TaxID=980422 RepID=R4S0Q6_PHYAS|nr:Hypothetical protein SLY_0424 [Strawberry lethal yellows phytoplasma (CPA) str. NZSb11]
MIMDLDFHQLISLFGFGCKTITYSEIIKEEKRLKKGKKQLF